MIYHLETEKRLEARYLPSYLALAVGIVLLLAAMPAGAGGIMDVRTSYERAVKERGRAVADSLGEVNAFLKDNPEDVVAIMYQGSLYTICAADSFFPWKKLYYLRKGIDLMDSAMDRLAYATPHGRDPELEMLLVRAMTNVRIPRVFNRAGLARRDLDRIIEHPEFKAVPERVRAEVLAWAAFYAREDGDASRAEDLMVEARALDAAAAEAVWSVR